MKKQALPAETVQCEGEAHQNAYIDHCMICLHHTWGKLFVCPSCKFTIRLDRKPQHCGNCGQYVKKP